MEHKTGRRQWVKLWVHEWLDGTTRFELTPSQRLLWVDLLAMAGKSRFPGFIYAGEGFGGKRIGYPIDYLSGVLRMDEVTLNNALKLLVEHEHITLEETDSEHYVIGIVNWNKYQSEYQRQKSYRKKPVENKEDIKINTNSYNVKHEKVTSRRRKEEEGEVDSVTESTEYVPTLQDIKTFKVNFRRHAEVKAVLFPNTERLLVAALEKYGLDRTVEMIPVWAAEEGESLKDKGRAKYAATNFLRELDELMDSKKAGVLKVNPEPFQFPAAVIHD